MTRQSNYEVVTPKPLRVKKTAYACDSCGRPVSPDEMDDGFANELVIMLNQDECVHTSFRRDYCTSCLEGIWQRICEAISADPDAEGFDRADEDD